MSDALHDERLMAVLLDWWWNDIPDPADTGPDVAIDDMRALIQHLAEHGYCIAALRSSDQGGETDG